MSRALFFAALLIAAPFSAAAQERYFAAIEDLPLAPQMEESDSGFVFEGAEGRIVSAIARGPADAEEVRAFYRAALPALGWSESPGEKAPEYVRGRERLTLVVTESEAGAVLEARLIVRPAPRNSD